MKRNRDYGEEESSNIRDSGICLYERERGSKLC